MQHRDLVGLYLDKSLESLLGIYAILKLGAAYVPLDPAAPPARLATIAANAGLRCLVTGAEKAELWPELLEERPSRCSWRRRPDGEVEAPDGAAGHRVGAGRAARRASRTCRRPTRTSRTSSTPPARPASRRA